MSILKDIYCDEVDRIGEDLVEKGWDPADAEERAFELAADTARERVLDIACNWESR